MMGKRVANRGYRHSAGALASKLGVGGMDPGAESRLKSLRQSAKSKILDPLIEHRWTASIVREEPEDSGWLVIDASRGGRSHRVALLYTSAIKNSTFKRIAAEVEHIFLNGKPYKLESFAYGIATPITEADAFFDLLLKWNAETEDALSATPEVIVPRTDDEYRRLQSENPIDAIWMRLRQLQSVSLARKTVAARLRKRPDDLQQDAAAHEAAVTSKGEGLAFAVRNATDYFRLKQEQNVSQRVLNLYYGTLSFAFAEMLASPTGPSTLAAIEDMTKQGHGLYTIDGSSDGIEQLVVGVISSGYFARWMEFQGKPVTELPQRKPKVTSDLLKQPATTFATLTELFARVPDLADVFFEISDQPPAWVEPIYGSSANPPHWDPTRPRASSTYITLLDRSCRVTREDILRFPNAFKEVTEVSSKYPGRHFRVRVDHPDHEFWHEVLPLHRSPFTANVAGTLILPLFGTVTEFRSIALALLYGLSIVVRYRPSVWRRVQEGDLDHYRALVESFLSIAERVLPEQFLASILGIPVHVRQPHTL
jgi:hypothetical protein